MAINSIRKSYTDKLVEVETAVANVHVKLGNVIASMRRVGLAPSRELMLAYDDVLGAINNIAIVKTFSRSMVFADEVN